MTAKLFWLQYLNSLHKLYPAHLALGFYNSFYTGRSLVYHHKETSVVSCPWVPGSRAGTFVSPLLTILGGEHCCSSSSQDKR